MRLYDKKSSITWAYRDPTTPEDMKNDPILGQFFERPVVLYDDNEGVVYDFKWLDVLILDYAYNVDGKPDIDINDPEAALEIIKVRMNEPRRGTLTDLQAQIDIQAKALEELISLQLGD